jgi:pimeloyl-ACP methyl ester carboxylesterase
MKARFIVAAVLLVCMCGYKSIGKSTAASTAPLILSVNDADETAKLKETRTPNTTDPTWVYQRASSHPSDTVLVFVHGIFGDTRDTWLNKETGKHFYDLIAEDPKFHSALDIFAFGFPSYELRAGSFDIDEAAHTLDISLKSNDIYKYQKIVFAAHSMGGLVVMRYLVLNPQYVKQVPDLVFFSTPQEGSRVSDIARRFLNNPSLAQMSPADSDDFLRELDADWKSIPGDTRPIISCAYEKLDTFGMRVVNWSSATRFCNHPGIAVEADHIDIVKPKNTASPAYQTFASALIYAIQGSIPSANERDVLQLLMDHLCDRGVLKNPATWEVPGPVFRSVNEIHGELVQVLSGLPVGSRARTPIQTMQEAALRVLQNPSLFPPGSLNWPRRVSGEMMQAVLVLRSTFSSATAEIVENYGLTGNCVIAGSQYR